MTNLLALADRVEKLTGPDREVAEEIALLMLSEHPLYKDRLRSSWDIRIAVTGWLAVDGDPTASLDAAMKLVPEGWTKVVDASAPECGIDVELFSPDESAPSVKGTHPKIGEPVKQSEALALTVACLRARASTDKGEA